MNRSLPDMLQCNSDMTVFERQRDHLKWQHQLLHQQQHEEEQQQQSYFSELSGVFSSQGSFQGSFMSGGDSVMTQDVKLAWPELGKLEMASLGFDQPCQYGNGLSFNMNYAISRTSSFPPTVAAAVATEAMEVKAKESSIVLEKTGLVVGRDSFKKRKPDKLQNSKGVVVEDESNKRIKLKGYEEEGGESNITGSPTNTNKKETSNDTSKENSKVSEVQKPDYIHVRARRGQATDSHSLAERVRREKISGRMKYLQDLVPGCNKITEKAGMLDEIINYVQSLQRQVEFLSMKLAAVNPRLDFNVDNLFVKKEVFPSVGNGMSSEMGNPLHYIHFNPVQQIVSCGGLEMGVNSHEMALRRTTSAPVPIPHAPFLDSSCFTQILPSATWDAELQNLYNVGI